MILCVERRRDDWIAYCAGRPERWEAGHSRAQAVGKLALSFWEEGKPFTFGAPPLPDADAITLLRRGLAITRTLAALATDIDDGKAAEREIALAERAEEFLTWAEQQEEDQ